MYEIKEAASPGEYLSGISGYVLLLKALEFGQWRMDTFW